ncbi:hypothetical protein CCACVL1_00663 [Corchorus capsularis]|uniref:Uncharacterized protein n=1 Tax=Corchorus capsularis TaxID=210143 RepID=A0A1R3KVM5_COCAP|nr:hypothetical protein CCACVL1_00663 [Corchorus capsularis]
MSSSESKSQSHGNSSKSDAGGVSTKKSNKSSLKKWIQSIILICCEACCYLPFELLPIDDDRKVEPAGSEGQQGQGRQGQGGAN